MDKQGYCVAYEIARAGPFIWYTGHRDSDGRRVLLKAPARRPARLAEIEGLNRESELLRRLRLSGLPTLLDLVDLEGVPCLILEDDASRPLSERLRSGAIALNDFFPIASELCQVLSEFHRQLITVAGLTPATVFLSPDGRGVRVMDLSLAVRGAPDGTVSARAAWAPTPYISPEQTGRINRSLDHRSDYYSLGAILYEALTGRPPFESSDALELMHSHIARTPASPSSLNSEVPEQLSRIVLRLLAKAAEDRYQSALGIRHDLARCERAWVAERAIPMFDVAQRDVSEQFLIPQRLYGRDEELGALMRAFDATCSGRRSLVLVSGYPGIGKTTLIDELSRRVVQRGYFISGKFDQVVRNIPYGALIQAFRALIWQWLAEQDERLTTLRARLSAAMGPNAGVLAEVIPEIEFIIGKQPPPAPVDPVEAQNRFRYVFESFVAAVSGGDRPLVLFLDDLQWVDAATLDLLPALLTSRDVRHLLLVGAYRDNEADAGHLLAWAIDRLETSGTPVDRLALRPLGHEHVCDFLRDTLHTADGIDPLARLILEKTDGNPFFVIQFLKALYHDGLFAFDAERGGWTFRLEQIAAAGMTDNVIDLMTRRIQKLSPRGQAALRLAACIGSRFERQTYLAVSRERADEASAALAEALDAGLIKIEGAAYESPERLETGAVTYAFLHDRIQQAAYDLMPDDLKRRAHLDVGRLLLSLHDPDVSDERLFEIVGHLNLGNSTIGDVERTRMARLNLAAGRKAKVSTAYHTASLYLDAGIELLSGRPWATDYSLLLALYLEAAQCHHLCGRFDVAERYFEQLLTQAGSPADQAQVHALRIVLYENQSRFDEAIASAREGLALFDLTLPHGEEELAAALDREIGVVQQLLGSRRIPALLDLPVMLDAGVRTVMRILTSMWPPVYISGNQLLARLISATMVRLSLAHGNTEDSAYGYVTHAITIGPVRGDYASAYEWGELALRVNERFDDSRLRPKIQQQFQAHVKLWQRPFESCLPHAREARRSALESGDFTYAGYATVSESWPAFVASRNLDDFVRHYSSAFALLDRIRMTEFGAALRVIVNWALALQGRTAGPLSLSDAAFDEEAFAAKHQAQAPFFLTFLYTAHLHLNVLHERYRTALELARRARSVAVPGTLWPVLIEFWSSIGIAGLWPDTSEAERQEYSSWLAESHGSLTNLAASCPENFRCFALLTGAAREIAAGSATAAARLVGDAVRYARETENVQMHALANELAARLWLVNGDDAAALESARAARDSYLRWGAYAKVRQIEDRYEALRERDLTDVQPAILSPPAAADAASLDLATVLKVAHAISIEIGRDDLLRKLMGIALENAGAQRAVFLQDFDGALMIEAEANADPPRVSAERLPAEEKSLSLGIIRYVRRTAQAVVIANAAADERFSADPYIADGGIRSVLCVPVGHQGRTTGVFYLENNLTAEAFTPERIEIMRILAAQAAISLDNARLYEAMRTEVARRTEAERSLREAVAELQALKTRLETENVYLQEEIRTQHNFNEIVGNSPALLAALRRVELVAPTESSVLILGETGSGKELFARAIHDRSRRRNRPLVKVNCGAIPPGLVESELFGHVKGAFTGAIDKRIGRFEVANGGTIFLDEVGELPLDAQVKLLRVLQEQEFEPVGSSRTVRVNVRVIAATNRNLEQAVRLGTFRSDLLYRLNVVPIEVPPLRARRADIPLLASLFVTSMARRLGKPLQGLSRRSMERLTAYSWPGNVRELQNVIERAAILATAGVLELDERFAAERGPAPGHTPPFAGDTLDSIQRAHIISILNMTGGVVEGSKGAASILGLHPNTLRSRMKKLGITLPRSSS